MHAPRSQLKALRSTPPWASRDRAKYENPCLPPSLRVYLRHPPPARLTALPSASLGASFLRGNAAPHGCHVNVAPLCSDPMNPRSAGLRRRPIGRHRVGPSCVWPSGATACTRDVLPVSSTRPPPSPPPPARE